jgi:nucleoside-diphosphate-sugar epimerase
VNGVAGGPARDVLVTGVTGFTGGALALELARRGHRVRGLVRSREGLARLIEAGIEPRDGDIRDADAVARAAEGVERIYHIAAVFRSAGHPDSYYEDVNRGGVANVIAAARRHGVARVVHCSTMGVHGHLSEIPGDETSPFNPGDIYQETKLAGERIASAAFQDDVCGAIVRPMGIYGPGDLRFLKLFRAIRRGRFVMVGSGETLYHFAYIDDLVEGFILCGEHPDAPGGTYLIGGDDYITLNEFTGLIAEAVGARPPRWRIPVWPVMAAGAVCEAVCRPLGLEPPLHRRRVAFFTKDRAFSNEKARRELGFEPRIDMREGIRRTARWYFDQGLL